MPANALTAREKTKIVFGATLSQTGKQTPLTDCQQSMRWLFFNDAGWGPDHRQRVETQQDQAAKQLTQAWEAGQLPVVFQEAIARGCARGASFIGETEPRLLFLELGERIVQAPDSKIDWVAPGWSVKATKIAYDTNSKLERDRLAQPEWRKLTSKEDDSLLAFWIQREAHLRASSTNAAVQGLHAHRPPLSALGSDPARAILTNSRPVEDNARETWAERFGQNIKNFSAQNARSPSTDQTPLLACVMQNIGNERGFKPEAMRQWLQWVVDAPRTPWLQFDHSAAEWKAEHPFELLAQALRWTHDPLPYMEAARALLSMGYGPNFEYPAGAILPPVDEARRSVIPNALWAFVATDKTADCLPDILELLARAGGDWRQRGGSSRHKDDAPILSRVNARACAAAESGLPRQHNTALLALEKVFDLFVRLGADPLEALPPPTATDAAEGRIRESVGARLERKALIASLSQADMEEALALLEQKRAQEAASRGDLGKSAAPAPKRNRL